MPITVPPPVQFTLLATQISKQPGTYMGHAKNGFWKKQAAPANSVTGGGKSKGAGKHKEGKGPSSGEKRLPIRGNQAVHATAKTGTIPDSESMTKSTEMTKEDVAAVEKKAGSRGHERWQILHSVSKKRPAVENQGIPAVAEVAVPAAAATSTSTAAARSCSTSRARSWRLSPAAAVDAAAAVAARSAGRFWTPAAAARVGSLLRRELAVRGLAVGRCQQWRRTPGCQQWRRELEARQQQRRQQELALCGRPRRQ